MVTPSTRKTARQSRSSDKPAPRTLKPDSRPFLRFYHSDELRNRTLTAITALEQAQDPTAHRAALADIAVELTNCGMDYFFMKPLKAAKAGFIIQQSANIGLLGAQQVMGTVIRNIIGRMNAPQLLSVCGSIRQLMR
jgi:hypothetical protein